MTSYTAARDPIPAKNFSRWTPLRRDAVIEDIDAGAISVAAAIKRYGLSDEELAAWRRDYALRAQRRDAPTARRRRRMWARSDWRNQNTVIAVRESR
jgi:Protein of unknown function (DUF1153)